MYIAAFAVGARLMFADRPKHITFQRLYNLTSLAGEATAYALADAQLLSCPARLPNFNECVDDGSTDLLLFLRRP